MRISTLALCLLSEGNALVVASLLNGIGLSCCSRLVAPDIAAGNEDTVAGDNLTRLEEGNTSNK